jgi:hypothetical protein
MGPPSHRSLTNAHSGAVVALALSCARQRFGRGSLRWIPAICASLIPNGAHPWFVPHTKSNFAAAS